MLATAVVGPGIHKPASGESESAAAGAAAVMVSLRCMESASHRGIGASVSDVRRYVRISSTVISPKSRKQSPRRSHCRVQFDAAGERAHSRLVNAAHLLHLQEMEVREEEQSVA